MRPCGGGNSCADCCSCSWGALLGVTGAAAPFEAVRILCWDVSSSDGPCAGCTCRGTGRETVAFGLLRLVQAQTESAPMLFLVSMVFTFDGLRKVALESPILLFTALLSLANCALALTHFITSPATESSHRARDELLVHCYDGDGASHARRKVWGVLPADEVARRSAATRRSFPMVLNLGLLLYFCADLTLRVVALCVITYAVGEQLTAILLPGALGAWLVARFAICCLPCGGGGGYGYRDVVSIFEGGARDLKRVLTPAFMDSALTARLISVDFLLSSLVCGGAIVVGLQRWLPHPHVDPDLRYGVALVAVAALVAKYVCFVWCVFPGLTLRYSVLGVGRVYSALEEATAAIAVQRYWRYLLSRRGRLGHGPQHAPAYGAGVQIGRLRAASRPAAYQRVGRRVQLAFIHRITKSIEQRGAADLALALLGRRLPTARDGGRPLRVRALTRPLLQGLRREPLRRRRRDGAARSRAGQRCRG